MPLGPCRNTTSLASSTPPRQQHPDPGHLSGAKTPDTHVRAAISVGLDPWLGPFPPARHLSALRRNDGTLTVSRLISSGETTLEQASTCTADRGRLQAPRMLLGCGQVKQRRTRGPCEGGTDPRPISRHLLLPFPSSRAHAPLAPASSATTDHANGQNHRMLCHNPDMGIPDSEPERASTAARPSTRLDLSPSAVRSR